MEAHPCGRINGIREQTRCYVPPYEQGQEEVLQNICDEEAAEEGVGVDVKSVLPLHLLLNAVAMRLLPQVLVGYIAAGAADEHTDEEVVHHNRVEHRPQVAPERSPFECYGIGERCHGKEGNLHDDESLRRSIIRRHNK